MSEIKAEVEQPEPTTSIPRNKGHRRSRRIDYTEQEYGLIEEAAEIEGKPISVFIQEESLAVQFKARPFLRNSELMGELKNCGLTLHRLATTARETRALPAADELETAFEELQALVRQIASAGTAKAR
jgi:hypothetical protein